MNISVASPAARTEVADGDEPGSPSEPEPEPRPAHSSSHPRIDVIDRTGHVRADSLRRLSEHLNLAAEHLPREVGSLSVVLVDEGAMASLHERHLGDRSTTDVLTFDLGGAPDEAIEAEVALCIDEARRQAAARGHTVERELLLYALHGLLHCCGHDDHDAAGFAAMHAAEDRILRAIGVGATFDTGDFTSDESGHDDSVALRNRDTDSEQ